MKRTLSLLLAVLCLFFLSQCGSTNSKTKYQVSISAVPSNGGSVSPSSGQYKEGTEIHLEATPTDNTWKFDHWSGDYSGTNPTGSVTVTKAMNIKAHFSKKQYKLTVHTDGKGQVEQKIVQSNASTAKDYDAGTTVQLTAKPDQGWKFVKWTGDLSGTKNPAQIRVKKAKTVTAIFKKKSFTLTVKTDGNGTVTKKPDQKTYKYNTEVTLTAEPDQGWKFVKWKGDISDANNPLTVKIDTNQTVIAVFGSKEFAGGSGTKADPYQVSTLKQLQSMRNYLGAHFILINNIDASVTKSWNNGRGFKPIGDKLIPFTGYYNGQNYKIFGLYINRENQSNIGLFGYVSEWHEGQANLKNINLVNVTVIGGTHVGGLVGFCYSCVIKNVTVSGLVKGGHGVGGLVGWAENTTHINNSSSSADVSGGSTIGGLVGLASIGYIKNSFAIGNVTGYSNIGGLIGFAEISIINSYAIGNVSGHYEVGGLAGFSENKIKNSYATGDVTGAYKTGGLIGINNGGEIINSYATGRVTGTGNNIPNEPGVGGLIGLNRGTIKSSYAKGNVIGNNYLGGLVGLSNSGYIINSYALGNVTGKNKVGGLVGVQIKDVNGGISKILNSFSVGNVNGNSDVGGFVGVSGKDHIIKNSYWDINSSNQTQGIGRGGSSGVTGLKTSEMTGNSAKKYMKGFDFSNVWMVLKNGYPILKWQKK